MSSHYSSPIHPILIPAYPQPIPVSVARAALSPAEFKVKLREAMVSQPTLTLHQVATALGVSRQAVSHIVGRLGKAHPSPKKDRARSRLLELELRVSQGEAAEHAAQALGISLNAAIKLGFRAHGIKPMHGATARAKTCPCWRCRRAAGIAQPRSPRLGDRKKAQVLDWCAWRDPDEGTALSQQRIGRLCGVGQGAVSRIAKAA